MPADGHTFQQTQTQTIKCGRNTPGKGKVSQLASKERAAHSFHFSLLIPFLTPCHPIQAQPAIPLKSINPDVRTTVMYNPASQPTGGSQSTYKMKNERLDGKILRETTQSE
jgi:hypothetical protein